MVVCTLILRCVLQDGSLDTHGSNARMVKLAHDVANSRPSLPPTATSDDSLVGYSEPSEDPEDAPAVPTVRRRGRPKRSISEGMGFH